MHAPQRHRPKNAKCAFPALLPALAALFASLLAPAPHAAPAGPAPPPTRVEVVRDTLHGVVIADAYRWLEDKQSPGTRAWIEAQNRYRETLMARVPGREALKARLERLLKVDVTGIPLERGGRYFFSKRRADQEQRVIYLRRGPAGQDEVLVDPHPLSADHTTSVSIVDVCSDGTLLAIGTRQGGADEVAVSFLDVDSRRELADRLPPARYFGVAIKPDRSGFFYSRFTPAGSRVYEHAMGTDSTADRLLFGEGYGPEKIITIELSEEGKHLLVSVLYGSAAERSELWVMDLARGGPPAPVAKDLEGFFFGAVAGDQLYMHTNWQAPKGRVLRADLRDPAREHWREIVPEGANVIEGLSLAGGRLFVNELENVVSKVRVLDADGRPLGAIAFPTLGTVGAMNGRWGSSEAFFSFSSFVVPATIFRYDVATGERTVWWRSQAPVESDRFETSQVWYTSKDGTRVPMFLVHRKGLKLDGSNPTLLTGYGGFTVNMTPNFSADAALWVENGGVYAQPNLRGGSEFGEAWHRAGMLGNKQNVFDDFIAAAGWLVANRYTRPGRLAIEGGSNGGLLVGAAITQRPELFSAAICAVPLLDMLRYHRFLVARFWVPEYGSSEDSAQFRWLHAYSPYQHVKKGVKYPAVLLVSGDSDTRVDPLHARKMTALLQASTGSDRPILLHYDTKSGHAGGKPVSKQIEDGADEMHFLLWRLGMTPAPAGAVAPAAARP
ncbi:MAG: S9 family peptidase [Candidatus Eisenbacteria bacterium]|nr:S9 family peptidase [Candidatus Eisenbacteria bacterium]